MREKQAQANYTASRENAHKQIYAIIPCHVKMREKQLQANYTASRENARKQIYAIIPCHAKCGQ